MSQLCISQDSDEMQSNKITLADGSFKNSLFPTSVPTIFQLLEASFTESYHIIQKKVLEKKNKKLKKLTLTTAKLNCIKQKVKKKKTI